MPFSTSSLPLEHNPDYIKSDRFSYAEFSTWFNEVKIHLDSGENVTNLKSDRMEAIFDQYGTFMQLTLCPTGFSMSTIPEVRARFESAFGAANVSYPVPEAEEDESLVSVTRRWVLDMHENIRTRVRNLKLRVRWFDFSYEEDPVEVVEPPELMGP